MSNNLSLTAKDYRGAIVYELSNGCAGWETIKSIKERLSREYPDKKSILVDVSEFYKNKTNYEIGVHFDFVIYPSEFLAISEDKYFTEKESEKLFDEIIKIIKPTGAVICNDRDFVERALVSSLKKQNVPIALLQESIRRDKASKKFDSLGLAHGNQGCDLILCWSEKSKEYFKSVAQDLSKIAVVGSPRMDLLKQNSNNIEKKDARARLGIENKNKVILITTSPMDAISELTRKEYKWCIENLISSLEEVLGAEDYVLFRNHRNENEKISKFGIYNIIGKLDWITNASDAPLELCLAASDKHINFSSTVAIESAIFNVESSVYNPLEKDYGVDYVETGLSKNIRVKSDLESFLSNKAVDNNKNLACYVENLGRSVDSAVAEIKNLFALYWKTKEAFILNKIFCYKSKERVPRKLNVVRLGNARGATRFLDLLTYDEITSLTIFSGNPDLLYLQMENAAIRTDNESLLKKVSVYKEPLKVTKKSKAEVFLDSVDKIKSTLNEADIIWLGDSDGDMPCEWANALVEKQVKTPYILGYKETRFRKKYEELRALKMAKGLIFPSSEYINFFGKLYGIKISNYKVGDHNWHLNQVVSKNVVNSKNKPSNKDGVLKVCVLAGKLRDESEKNEERSGARYYIINHLIELAEIGLEVHVHTMQRTGGGVPDDYKNLQKKFPNIYFHNPLKLTPGSKDYEVLASYDYGFTHPPVDPDQIDLHEFQKVNIPNRFYEYLMCQVKPIVIKGSLPVVEKYIENNNFGIIYTDYKDLYSKIKNDKGDFLGCHQIKTFKDYAEAFVQLAASD